MSHFSRLQTKIVDLAYLKRALTDMNFEFEEGRVKIRGYLGRKMTVDLRVKTPDGYDIGFVKSGDTYEVVADWDMLKSVEQQAFVKEVMRSYAYHVVRDQLEVQDYCVVQEQRQGETVSLTMRRM